MFCGKCGKQLADDTSFCPFCGAPTDIAPKTEESERTSAPKPAQVNFQKKPIQPKDSFHTDADEPVPASNKKKAILLGSIAGAAAVVVVILLFVFLGPGGFGNKSTPDAAAKKFEKALNNMNTKEIVECFDSSTKEAFYEYVDETDLDYDLSSITDTLGVKFSFTVTPSDYEYYDNDGIQYCDVDLNIAITASFLGQSYSDDESIDMTYVMEGNEWKIYGNLDDIVDLFDELGSFMN